MSASSRERVLADVRRALADVPADERPEDVEVPSGHRRTLGLDHEALVELFVERASDYKARVVAVPAAQLAAAVASTCADLGIASLGVPPGLPAEWLSGLAGVEVRTDAPALAVPDLDRLDASLTGVALAIADTGTVVLDGSERCGRRALTLVPDRHVCVVDGSQVVGSVPEALAALEPTRPLTFVSGPSATSDIELSRVEGVHGPRTLVLLVVLP